jgi:hypothetical protein
VVGVVLIWYEQNFKTVVAPGFLGQRLPHGNHFVQMGTLRRVWTRTVTRLLLGPKELKHYGRSTTGERSVGDEKMNFRGGGNWLDRQSLKKRGRG